MSDKNLLRLSVQIKVGRLYHYASHSLHVETKTVGANSADKAIITFWSFASCVRTEGKWIGIRSGNKSCQIKSLHDMRFRSYVI